MVVHGKESFDFLHLHQEIVFFLLVSVYVGGWGGGTKKNLL